MREIWIQQEFAIEFLYDLLLVRDSLRGVDAKKLLDAIEYIGQAYLYLETLSEQEGYEICKEHRERIVRETKLPRDLVERLIAWSMISYRKKLVKNNQDYSGAILLETE